MKFFGIHLDDLEGEAFAKASDAQIVTWLFLHAYCCKQLNGGEIRNAGGIPPKLWLRHGIEHHEILSQPSPLWHWHEGSIQVTPYDLEGQSLWEKKSRAGKETAKKRWGRNSTAKGSASRSATGSSSSTHDAPDQTSTRPVPSQRTPKPPKGDSLPHGDRFSAAWSDWKTHRSEIRKPLKPSTVKAQLKKLADISEDEACACIQRSIENGWTGLFPEKRDGSRNTPMCLEAARLQLGGRGKYLEI